MDIGIVSYGLYIPGKYETAEEMAGRTGLTAGELNDMGIQRKYIPGQEDHPVVMAVKAAQQALE